MKITRYLAPGLLAGSLLVGGAASASAAQKSGAVGATKTHATHRMFAYGQVSNLTGAGFTVTRATKKATASKVIQVVLGSATKERARKGTSGPLANGEYAFVIGTKGASAVTAKHVLYSGKAFSARHLIRRIKAHRRAHRAAGRALRRHVAGGLVNAAATTSAQISITTAKGKTLVFAITTHTKYRVNKALSSTAPTFTNGEKVRVRFAHNRSTKGRTARVINVVAGA